MLHSQVNIMDADALVTQGGDLQGGINITIHKTITSWIVTFLGPLQIKFMECV